MQCSAVQCSAGDTNENFKSQIVLTIYFHVAKDINTLEINVGRCNFGSFFNGGFNKIKLPFAAVLTLNSEH